MKFLSLLSLVGMVSSAAISLEVTESPLKVLLEMTGNTKVKATLTNTGDAALKLLKTGTFLDSKPVEKVQIYNSETKVAFAGIRYNILYTGLSEEHFTTIQAKESVDLAFDMAELHDLSASGEYTIYAQGAIPVAEESSTVLAGKIVTYTSNVLNIQIDGAKAAHIKLAIDSLGKRTQVSTDCTGSKKTALTTALSNCARLASAAATAATSGSATKFSEYFKTTSSSTRSTVAARLNAVASECSSSTSGATSYHCTDTYSDCESNVLAYTLPSRNYVVSCPIYFSALPALASTCHGQDQATTTLHEFTHAPGVYSPGTQDNAYGYSDSTKLSASAALNNADTYALYANAIYLGC